MDPCSDQFERNPHTEDQTRRCDRAARTSDFVCSRTPCKAADATQMLCFSEERFTSLQRRFAQCTLDGDAGNVCNLRDEILLNLRRACRTGLENGESSHHTSVSREDRRRPLRAEAVRERERSNGTRLKEWIRFKICHDHLRLSKRCYAAGSDLRRNSQTFTGIIEGPGEAGYSSYPELRTTPIDQVNAAATVGGCVFDKFAQSRENVAECTARATISSSRFSPASSASARLRSSMSASKKHQRRILAVCIFQGEATHVEPTIDAIVPAMPRLAFVRLTSFQGFSPGFNDVSQDRRMNDVLSRPKLSIHQGLAEVIQDPLVQCFNFAGGRQRSD